MNQLSEIVHSTNLAVLYTGVVYVPIWKSVTYFGQIICGKKLQLSNGDTWLVLVQQNREKYFLVRQRSTTFLVPMTKTCTYVMEG